MLDFPVKMVIKKIVRHFHQDTTILRLYQGCGILSVVRVLPKAPEETN